MTSRTISRRTFLHLGSVASAAAVLAACGQAAPSGEAPAAAAPAAPAAPAQQVVTGSGGYQEAPMLSELVKAGTLPPVDQRLPEVPLVVKPLESVGTYGGQWRTGTIERNGNDLFRNIGYEQLMRYTPTYDAVIPNVAESVVANDEGSEYTFTLRKGLKWSDGTPFTTDDVVFWYEDVLMNAEVTPTPPRLAFTITKVDDVTFKWTFEAPNGLFLKDVARRQ